MESGDSPVNEPGIHRAEMFADVVREVLLQAYAPSDRRGHFVPATHMARAAAPTILAALDAVRATAARGESRDNAVSAFVRAISRATTVEQPRPSVPSPDGPSEDEIGADAVLLSRAAADFSARALEADGLDPEEADRCRSLADGLHGLSVRHERWFVGRDILAPASPRDTEADASVR